MFVFVFVSLSLYPSTEGLHAVGIEGDCSLALIPSSVADVDDEALELNLAAVDALMELDDVDSVEHNMA